MDCPAAFVSLWRHNFPIRLAAAIIVSVSTGFAEADSPRATDGLQVLYHFDEPQNATIADQSGQSPPLDMTIETPAALTARDGHMDVTSSARIRTSLPASKLVEAVKQSGELTVEAWITPRNDRQKGPARIVSLSADANERNFTLGQDGDRFDVRLRTTESSTNGLPSTTSPAGSLNANELTHVVFTREQSGAVSIWINGSVSVTGKVSGDFTNWDISHHLLLANEAGGNRPWTGGLHLIAVYSRALTGDEIERNFAAGAPAAIDYAALLPPAVDRMVDFVTDVQPIFRERCFECHATGNEGGGLNLGTRARVMEGGEGGVVLKAGHSAGSRLIHLVAGIQEDQIMPPEGEPLTDDQVGILRAWIDQGADWPAGADVPDPRTERAREHWAFQPLREVEPPQSAHAAWSRTAIDRFILAKLEEHDLSPSPPISARKLIRRISFGLTGLPPQPAEIDEFVAACETDRTTAVDELVNRLLESRHYGERWGRHWLDVARYADSDGQEGDKDRPHAYHYRDFVIRAFNDDMSFDQFVCWQLAGDEYEPQNPSAVAATGFIVAGPHTVLGDTFLEEELLRNRYNELDDMLATTGTAMLGLTFGCARCHDHKYDAISAREYYRLLSAFHSGDREEVRIDGKGPKILSFRDHGAQPATTWLFERADFYDRDQLVKLGFLKVLMRDTTVEDYQQRAQSDPPRADTTYQRKALAEWMTDVEHGAGALLARVIVNRVWQHHFGEGIVRTVDDFGVRSEPPTHPELLEWLAHDLVANGWKLKRLHRLILASAVYEQGVDFDPVHAKTDPGNRFLWRRRPQRLEAEVLRDAMLAVSGTLNLEPYGPAFKPPIPKEAVAARNLKSKYPDDAKDEPSTRRRTVYMFHKRVVPYPLLQAFDRPDLLQSCGRREQSTVAPQALALMNDGFVRARSADLAERLLDLTGADNVHLVEAAFRLALGRPPTESERSASVEFVAAQSKRNDSSDSGKARLAAVTNFCQTLFSLNEFLYVD